MTPKPIGGIYLFVTYSGTIYAHLSERIDWIASLLASIMTDTSVDWKEYRKEFAWDGSWRDIYVLKTDLRDWQHFIQFIRNGGYHYQFSLGGDPAMLPDDVKDIFRWDRGPLLSIDVGSIEFHCHFFTEQEIEFDFDPREITGVEKAEAIFRFLKSLGKALSRPIRMTPENLEQSPIFEYDPESDSLKYGPWDEKGK